MSFYGGVAALICAGYIAAAALSETTQASIIAQRSGTPRGDRRFLFSIMPSISTNLLNNREVTGLLSLSEGHFSDIKSKDIAPAKLTKTICAMANTEGGEVYIGIEDSPRAWNGFSNVEEANGHIQIFERLFPLGSDFQYEFLAHPRDGSLVLKIYIAKTRDIKQSSDGTVYVRRGAQNLPVDSPERMDILRRDKGITSFESESVNCDIAVVTQSQTYLDFLDQIVPRADPVIWLRKQLLLNQDKPTVACMLLFSEEPQAALPKRCGIKVYRYKTSSEEGSRDTLEGIPQTIEGWAYKQINTAVQAAIDVVQSVTVRTAQGLGSAQYPHEAIHEILTNAVIHRDYSITEDIHIRIFDNRIEVWSPGVLPGHITVDNILDERFARNPAIVRLLNKFPDPPNRDVGEGLNTAFQSMQKMRLKPPVIKQDGGYVKVTLKHESLATPEEAILAYLRQNNEIANRNAREICYIPSENKMKRVLQSMVRKGLIRAIPNRTGVNSAYELTDLGKSQAATLDARNDFRSAPLDVSPN